MSKLHAIITKEFKLLFRSKSSTLAVLLGPLILVLMVGLVFTNATDQELVIGVTAEYFPNSQEYVQSLEEAFRVVHYEESCEEDVRRSVIVSCVSLTTGTPPRATIYVDPSNVNVVYAVIDQITGQLETQTGTLREGLADNLLTTVSLTRNSIITEQERLTAAHLLFEQQQDRMRTLATDIEGIRVDVQTVSAQELTRAEEDSVGLRGDYQELLGQVLRSYRQNADNTSREAVAFFEDEYETLNDRANQSRAEDVFLSITQSMQSIQEQQSQAATSAQAISEQARQISHAMNVPIQEVNQTAVALQTAGAQLALNITQTDLTRPLEPVIEPVTSQEDDFAFMFPYFIMLIIMFTTLLMASTIIVREKNSSAYFRNFATPTPEWVFVLATYLTTLIVVAAQLVIIALAATLFLSFSLFSLTTLITLLVGITFFTLLGMLIGYSFKGYEGVMLASIAISALLLFVSDLVLPASTIPGAVQTLIQANPLVLAANLLNASIVFGFGLTETAAGIFVLVLYSVIMFALIMIVQRVARIRFFEVASAHEHINRFLGQQDIVSGKELVLGEWNVTSKEHLQQVLSLMTDDEYERYATHSYNLIADWVLDVYKDERLARELRNKSRKGAIEVLQKYS